MADDERPAVGTVAQEAARLLDALGGWATSARAGYAAGPASDAATPGPSAGGDSGAGHTGSGDPSPGPAAPERDAHGSAGTASADTPSADSPAGGGANVPRCESCGAENGMGQAVACQLCPVCQGIGLLRSVRPETVDRLADLAGALAATLRDIAGQRRADSGTAAPRKPSAHSSRSTVQDIAIDDEDAPGSATS